MSDTSESAATRAHNVRWKPRMPTPSAKTSSVSHTHGRGTLLWYLPLLGQFFFPSRRQSDWSGVRGICYEVLATLRQNIFSCAFWGLAQSAGPPVVFLLCFPCLLAPSRNAYRHHAFLHSHELDRHPPHERGRHVHGPSRSGTFFGLPGFFLSSSQICRCHSLSLSSQGRFSMPEIASCEKLPADTARRFSRRLHETPDLPTEPERPPMGPLWPRTLSDLAAIPGGHAGTWLSRSHRLAESSPANTSGVRKLSMGIGLAGASVGARRLRTAHPGCAIGVSPGALVQLGGKSQNRKLPPLRDRLR